MQFVIVLGICLPVLLLSGLKNGQINQLSKALNENSSGREIIVHSAGEGGAQGSSKELPTLEILDTLQKIKDLDCIIPEWKIKTVALVNKDEKKRVEGVHVLTTCPNDPRLKDCGFGCDLPNSKGEGVVVEEYIKKNPQLVLSQKAAEAVNAKEGNTIVVEVKRSYTTPNGELKTEIHSAEALVRHIDSEDKLLDRGNKGALNIHAHFGFANDLLSYEKGEQVEIFECDSLSPAPTPRYHGYLVFTRDDKPLSTDDKKRIDDAFHNKVEIQDVEDSTIISLGGLLNTAVQEEVNGQSVERRLKVYLVSKPVKSKNEKNNDATEKNGDPTNEDDSTIGSSFPSLRCGPAVIQWNEPLKKIKLKGKEGEYTVIGCTLPTYTEDGSWLTRKYLRGSYLHTFLDADSIDGYEFILDQRQKTTLNPFGLTDRSSGLGKTEKETQEPDDTAYPCRILFPNEESKDENVLIDIKRTDIKLKVINKSDLDSCEAPVAASQEVTETPDAPSANNIGAAAEEDTVAYDPVTTAPLTEPPIVQAVEDSSVVCPTEKIAIVPAALLAYFNDYQREKSNCCYNGKRFITKDKGFAGISSFRAYASNINTVEGVVDALQKDDLKFGAIGKEKEIAQLNKSISMLDSIVNWIIGVVCAFGTITIGVVLVDSTARKCGVIGILRAMGVSGLGIASITFIRSLIIGLFAVAVSLVVPFSCWTLTRLQRTELVGFVPEEVVIICIVTLTCCCLGGLVSAFYAQCLDPVTAISKGKT